MFHLFNRYDIAATELQFAAVDTCADQAGRKALRSGSGHYGIPILYSQDIAPLIFTKGPAMQVATCRRGDAGTGAPGNTHFSQCHRQSAITDVMGRNDMAVGNQRLDKQAVTVFSIQVDRRRCGVRSIGQHPRIEADTQPAIITGLTLPDNDK